MCTDQIRSREARTRTCRELVLGLNFEILKTPAGRTLTAWRHWLGCRTMRWWQRMATLTVSRHTFTFTSYQHSQQLSISNFQQPMHCNANMQCSADVQCIALQCPADSASSARGPCPQSPPTNIQLTHHLHLSSSYSHGSPNKHSTPSLVLAKAKVGSPPYQLSPCSCVVHRVREAVLPGVGEGDDLQGGDLQVHRVRRVG